MDSLKDLHEAALVACHNLETIWYEIGFLVSDDPLGGFCLDEFQKTTTQLMRQGSLFNGLHKSGSEYTNACKRFAIAAGSHVDVACFSGASLHAAVLSAAVCVPAILAMEHPEFHAERVTFDNMERWLVEITPEAIRSAATGTALSGVGDVNFTSLRAQLENEYIRAGEVAMADDKQKPGPTANPDIAERNEAWLVRWESGWKCGNYTSEAAFHREVAADGKVTEAVVKKGLQNARKARESGN